MFPSRERTTVPPSESTAALPGEDALSGARPHHARAQSPGSRADVQDRSHTCGSGALHRDGGTTPPKPSLSVISLRVNVGLRIDTDTDTDTSLVHSPNAHPARRPVLYHTQISEFGESR